MSATSSPHRSWPLWVVMLLFLAAAVSVPAIQHFRRPNPPRDLAELAEKIKMAHPDWHLVTFSANQEIRSGFWVCDRPRERDDLLRLVPAKERGQDWDGVVLCTARGERYTGEMVSDWGEYGQRIEPFAFFSDPELLQQIASVVSPH